MQMTPEMLATWKRCRRRWRNLWRVKRGGLRMYNDRPVPGAGAFDPYLECRL